MPRHAGTWDWQETLNPLVTVSGCGHGGTPMSGIRNASGVQPAQGRRLGCTG